jgi:hypothetical protein
VRKPAEKESTMISPISGGFINGLILLTIMMEHGGYLQLVDGYTYIIIIIYIYSSV